MPSRKAKHQLNNQVIIVTVIVVFCCLRYIFHEYLMNTGIRHQALQLSNNFTNHFQYFLLQHAPLFHSDETIVAIVPADASVRRDARANRCIINTSNTMDDLFACLRSVDEASVYGLLNLQRRLSTAHWRYADEHLNPSTSLIRV